MEQSGEDLTDIDPTTGARRKRRERDNRLVPDDDVDEESVMVQGPARSAENESQAAKLEAAALAGYLDDNVKKPDEEGILKQRKSYQELAYLSKGNHIKN